MMKAVCEHTDKPGTITLESRRITPNPSFQPSLATMMSQVSPSDHQREEKNVAEHHAQRGQNQITALTLVAYTVQLTP